jgi:hypothetical protein
LRSRSEARCDCSSDRRRAGFCSRARTTRSSCPPLSSVTSREWACILSICRLVRSSWASPRKQCRDGQNSYSERARFRYSAKTNGGVLQGAPSSFSRSRLSATHSQSGWPSQR